MKNEHRKIANELKLFDLSDQSPGMVLWYPKGYYIYQSIENYLRNIQDEYNYIEVKSPIIANKNLWKKSGHLDNFYDNMFFLDDENLAIKPMNCPFHISMFNKMNYFYKDLPVKMAEFGLCHRNEPSGSLNGLFRLRSFNQDDGHIFCRESQIKSELISFVNMIHEIYLHFGFKKEDISVNIALRPENRIGDDKLWDSSESSLKSALSEMNLPFGVLEGEGAFYGPKIEFGLKDSLGREWQCGVFQLDFLLSKRLDSSFINEKGEKEYPIVLHRAALGSLERFIAILIEHYNGKLPSWLNPNAVSIIPISDLHVEYSLDIQKELKSLGIQSFIDLSENSISYKIKNSFKQRSNYAFVIGDKEIERNIISIKEGNKNIAIKRSELIKFIIK